MNIDSEIKLENYTESTPLFPNQPGHSYQFNTQVNNLYNSIFPSPETLEK